MTILQRATPRELLVPSGGLAVLASLSWLALVVGIPGDGVAVFLAGWTVMMTAMMLPAAAPMILLFRLSDDARARPPLRTVAFVAGYLALWAAFGVVALALQSAIAALPMTSRPIVAALTLAAAGAYQFAPLKSACLRVCRSPADFLVSHWRGGPFGPFRMGIEHGVYCAGCCWALMAVLVIVGGMGLAWVALIALVVLVEKVVPRGAFIGRAVGVALLAFAAVLIARPDLVPVQMEGSM